MAETNKWSLMLKEYYVENGPSQGGCTTQGVIFLPSALTNFVLATGLILGGDKRSLWRTEQDAPLSSKMVTEFLFNFPCV